MMKRPSRPTPVTLKGPLLGSRSVQLTPRHHIQTRSVRTLATEPRETLFRCLTAHSRRGRSQAPPGIPRPVGQPRAVVAVSRGPWHRSVVRPVDVSLRVWMPWGGTTHGCSIPGIDGTDDADTVLYRAATRALLRTGHATVGFGTRQNADDDAYSPNFAITATSSPASGTPHASCGGTVADRDGLTLVGLGFKS
jgi:hypothetical protein